jgi:hypothetical protein
MQSEIEKAIRPTMEEIFNYYEDKLEAIRRLVISLMQSNPSGSTKAICHEILEVLK